MCTYFCDSCGHVFSTPRKMGWVVIDGRDECLEETCPRCGNPDFELVEKGFEVDDNQSRNPAGHITTKTKRVMYAIALLAVGWLFYYLT